MTISGSKRQTRQLAAQEFPAAFSCGTPGSIALRYTDFHADVNEALVRLNYTFGDRELAPLK